MTIRIPLTKAASQPPPVISQPKRIDVNDKFRSFIAFASMAFLGVWTLFCAAGTAVGVTNSIRPQMTQWQSVQAQLNRDIMARGGESTGAWTPDAAGDVVLCMFLWAVLWAVGAVPGLVVWLMAARKETKT